MLPQYSLQQIPIFYSSTPLPRYNYLIQKFTSIYHSSPDFISRAPGRVNIIGQHIDYQGYGVFPSAIEKDCLIAVKIIQDSEYVEVRHVDEEKYQNWKGKKNVVNNSQNKEKQEYPNKYLNYFMAGYKAGIQKLTNQQLVGMQVLITGNIPIGSGVSSSAALVVSSAVASYYSNTFNPKQSHISLSQFTQLCIHYQRQCGVACGGMDQSISIMGKLSSCLYIQFNPIRCERINVPDGCKLIIMNSLVENLKANSAVFRYNKRVVECRLAIYAMAKGLKIKQEIYKQWKILKDVQEYLKLQLKTMVKLVQSKFFIQQKKYTKKDINQLLGQNIWTYFKDIQRFDQVYEANDQFNLYQAAKHVFSQAQRVIDLIQIFNSNLSSQHKNKFFGKLMNQSHQSCRYVYQCSCEQLDQLTQLALKNGALGSRLTGAGWGGCTVSLVKDQDVEGFIEKMKIDYYGKQPFKTRAEKQGMENVIFQSKPSEGACIVLLK